MRNSAVKSWIAGVVICIMTVVLVPGAAWSKKKVIFSTGPDAKSLDSALHPGGSADLKAQAHIYDNLVYMAPDSSIQPGLATSWKYKNPTTIVFKLRRGVRFHDGTPFTAADVKFSIERALTHPRARLKSYIAALKSVQVIDDSTVEIHLKSPYAPALASIAFSVAAISSSTAIKRWGKNYRRHPVGTGPFIFKEWVAGEYIKYEANPNYWGGKPAIDELEHRVVTEATTRVLQLRAGQIHLAGFLPPTQMGDVEKDPKLDLVKAKLFRMIYVGMNNQIKPFDNVLVRRAVNYAVDTKTIIEKVMFGIGTISRGPFGPSIWGYDPEFEKMGYRHDPAKARQLLKEAGYPNGFDIEFWHPSGRYTADKIAAEAIQSNLANVGIRVKLRTGGWALVAPTIRKGKAPIFFYGFGAGLGDGDTVLYNKFHSSNWGRKGNYTRYKNPDMEKLVEEARGVTDPAKRKALYKKAAKIVIDDAPWLFFKQEMMLVGKNKKLKGVIYLPSERILFHKARLED